MKLTLATALLMTLTACGRTDFEQFAYDVCLKEGRHTDAICSCSASNLDEMLTNDEKAIYKKAYVGEFKSSVKLIPLTPKLQKAVKKCAE